MRHWFRQGHARRAGIAASRAGHHILRTIGTLALVLLLLAGAAAWRLSRGPVDLPPLASRIALAASRAMPGIDVTIGAADLAWEGFNKGGAPIDLRLSNIAILGQSGTVAARISRLRVTLAPLALLKGRIAPIRIAARHTEIILRPTVIPAIPGTNSTSTGAPSNGPTSNPIADIASFPRALGRLIARFSRAPGQGGLDLADLRAIRIGAAHLILDDRARGFGMAASDGRLDLTRTRAGVIAGEATADFAPRPAHRASGPVRLRITIAGHEGLGHVTATLGPVIPARFAPGEAAAQPLDLPLTLTASWPIGTTAPARAHFTLRAGAGHIIVTGTSVPIRRIDLAMTATPTRATLDAARIALGTTSRTTTARLTGTLDLTGSLAGGLDATVDHVTAPDLAADWPAGIVHNTRKYILNHIPAGLAQNGRFHAAFTLAGADGTPRLDDFTGNFTASGVTLDWFKHAVPMTGLAGTLDFLDRDILVIHATSGQLGRLALRGTMTISALTHHDQNAGVAATLTGNAADAVPLLDAPPLRLATHGIALTGMRGHLTAAIDAGLPLKKHLVLNDVHLAAIADITDLHLPLPVAGLALDRGNLALSASLKHLALHGAGDLADRRASFAAAMALPDGAFTLTAHTIAGRTLLARLGAPTAIWQSGAAPLAIEYRDDAGRGSLDLDADLTPVALALPRLGWRKFAGQKGAARIGLDLRHGSPVGVRRIDVTGPALALHGISEGRTLAISAARLGGTSADGSLTPPARPGAPWHLALNGPMLDIAAALDAVSPTPAPPPHVAPPHAAPPPGPPSSLPWRITAGFARLRLDKSPAPLLGAVQLDATGNEADLLTAHGTIGTGTKRTRFALTRPAGDPVIDLTANDAGALFAAAGTTTDIAGGKLHLTTKTRGATTKGRAVMTGFRLRHAPVMAKVLQGLTLYGVPAALSGPGLAMTRLVAPFTVTGPIVRLGSGRAHSSSIGFTATGSIDLATRRYDLSGTIVPAYLLNALLGKIPLVGKVFSPEKGSGLFAARYSVSGPFAKPKISVNPLSVLTPGILRELFGDDMKRAKPARKPARKP